jgi:predicted anti-sigma-YlaC factor YlaD
MSQTDVYCRRTRELLSFELDGELSELEAARLESHLARCPACRELKTELAGLTLALRATPLEPLERPVALPHRVRFALRPLRIAAAAAAVAVAAGLVGVVGTVRSHTPVQPRISRAPSNDNIDALRAARRPGMLKQVPVGRAGGHAPV